MQKELEALWEKCVKFHGHSCGGLAVGFQAVLYAWAVSYTHLTLPTNREV